jgi:hypothetical protein
MAFVSYDFPTRVNYIYILSYSLGSKPGTLEYFVEEFITLPRRSVIYNSVRCNNRYTFEWFNIFSFQILISHSIPYVNSAVQIM